MNVHFCIFDRECQSHGNPKRIYLHTKNHMGWISFSRGDYHLKWMKVEKS